MTLITVFVYFLFTALGLGLIHISQIYLKLSAHKKNMAVLAVSAENGIKQGFGYLAELVSEKAQPVVCAEEYYFWLREDTQAGNRRIAEEALGINLPLVVEGAAGDQIWRSSSDFSLNALSANENYFLADLKGTIASEGLLQNFRPKKKSSLDVSLKILAGHIPLAYFPFLIARDLDPDERQNFKENRNILFVPSNKGLIFPAMNFSDDSVIPDDVDPLLKKALNIKIFSPEKLSRSELRAALGLEMVNEPVPEGVYLINNDTGLGGIYVQGDLDEMILAIASGFQVISFRRGTDTWLLKFDPTQFKTSFSTPSETRLFDRVPLGIIMVNGCIRSLGGGIINPSGSAEIVRDEALPCILQGVSLSIVSADQITLSSHLVHQGVKWLDGIPYLKDSSSELVIYANGRDFVEDTEKAGKILIDPNAPREIKIQAALSAKNSLELGGSQKTLVLAGGFQAGELALNENTLKILPDERLLENKLIPQNSPLSKSARLWTLSVRPLQWNEF
jgi:hypothetical protein